MTLVAYFEDAAVGAWLHDRLQSLAAKDPARVIFLDATQPSGAKTVSADWLELGVADGDPEALQSVVASLSLPQAPLVLVWASKHVAGDARFAALASLARTVVYNSSALGTDDSGLRALVEFEHAHPEMLVSDIAYLRLAPWQESIALFSDGKNVIRELFDLRRVEIASGSAAEAYYLLRMAREPSRVGNPAPAIASATGSAPKSRSRSATTAPRGAFAASRSTRRNRILSPNCSRAITALSS